MSLLSRHYALRRYYRINGASECFGTIRRQPLPQRRRCLPMALDTQRPHVREIALAPTLRHRQNMVGVPQVLAPSPFFFEPPPRREIELPLIVPQYHGINAANGADPVVTREYLVAEIPRIRPQLPVVHARVAAEREPPLR